MLPYTWSDVWALQATAAGLRGELGTVRELASRLTEARSRAVRLQRVPSWTGPAADEHRAVLARVGSQAIQRANNEVATVGTQLVKHIEGLERRIQQMQAALMAQEAAARAAAAKKSA